MTYNVFGGTLSLTQSINHLPFWFPGFVKFIMLLLHVLFACWNKYKTTTTNCHVHVVNIYKKDL